MNEDSTPLRLDSSLSAATEPKLFEDRQAPHLYNAACSAALAASGCGKDEHPPTEAAKAKLRMQALEWLQSELASWSKILESGPADMKPAVSKVLEHWKEDAELASLRDERELATLPKDERAELMRLWSNVDQLLSKARK